MPELKQNQLQAIEMILEGKTDVAISKELNIDKSTLYRWKKEDVFFISEYRKASNDIREAIKEKHRKLLETSLEVLGKSLTDDKLKVQVAMNILKSFDMDRLGKFLYVEPNEVIDKNY
jgi:transposase